MHAEFWGIVIVIYNVPLSVSVREYYDKRSAIKKGATVAGSSISVKARNQQSCPKELKQLQNLATFLLLFQKQQLVI